MIVEKSLSEMRKNILFFLLAFTASGICFAQQDALFTQYMFNKLALNPGYVGSREALSGDILYRSQWVGIDGAPKTFSASIHSPLPNEHVAVGLTAYNDKLGPVSTTGVLATGAYRVIFPDSKLSFGLQAGFYNSNIDRSMLNPSDQSDPALDLSSANNKMVPDVNVGVYYYSEKYFVGFSSKHLLQNQTIVVRNAAENKNEFSKLFAHFYIMGGAVFPVADGVLFRPSTFVKFVKNSPPQMDLNVSFLLKEKLWLGTSYRAAFGKDKFQQNALCFLVDFNVLNNLRIGYSYDISLNELKTTNKGSHEIRLGFDINVIGTEINRLRCF